MVTASANTSGAQRGIFLSWTTRNGRTADLAERLDLDSIFIRVGAQRTATVLFRWAAQSVMSLPALFRPGIPVIAVMMPPYPVLLLCRAVAKVRGIPLIVDCHSAVFEDDRFKRFLPSTLKHLKRSSLTIVTNRRHRDLCESHGIAVTELHDPPAPLGAITEPDATGHVLVPASWHNDEPMVEMVAAAAELPDLQFVITGTPLPAVRAEIGAMPSNVTVSGFVSNDEYNDLLAKSSMVFCMTLNDNTMQRGGYEALAKGLPLVTSDFDLLRDYFGDAAEYAEPRATASLVAAIKKVMADHSGYSSRMSQRRDQIEADYDKSTEPIRAVITAG